MITARSLVQHDAEPRDAATVAAEAIDAFVVATCTLSESCRAGALCALLVTYLVGLADAERDDALRQIMRAVVWASEEEERPERRLQ